MGEWLTVGGVVLVWALVVVAVVAIRLARGRAALDNTAADLERALRRRHEVAAGFVESLARHDVLTATADLVRDARMAVEVSEGTSSVRQAGAERNLDAALRDAGEYIDNHPRLRSDPEITAFRQRLDALHADISEQERHYDRQANLLARQRGSWPGRWIARWLRMQ